MFAVTVEFRIKPEHADSFRKAIHSQASNSLEGEADCHQFDVCFSAEDAAHCFLYEKYTDKAAFEAHTQTPHFANFSATAGEWIASKTLQTWQCG